MKGRLDSNKNENRLRRDDDGESAHDDRALDVQQFEEFVSNARCEIRDI